MGWDLAERELQADCSGDLHPELCQGPPPHSLIPSCWGTAGSWASPSLNPQRSGLGLTSGFVQSIAVMGTLYRDFFSVCKQGFLTLIRRLFSALLTVVETKAEQTKHFF